MKPTRKIKIEEASVTKPTRIQHTGFKPRTHAEVKVELGRLLAQSR